MGTRKIILLSVLALTFVSLTAAQDFQVEEYNITNYTEEINSHSDELPGFVKDLVGGEDINIYIEREDEEKYNLSVTMDSMNVENISTTQLDEPTLEVWASEDIVQKVVESDEPVQKMKEAINEGDIEYEANKAWTKVKLFFADIFMKIL